MSDLPTLSRSLPDQPAAPPVRIVHIGLGNFHRAHQCWYTSHAADGAEWGIASFGGRSATAYEALAPQDGLFTLLVRGADGDSPEVVGSIAKVHRGDDFEALMDYLAAPETSIITATVTEQGYQLTNDGRLNTANEALAADIAALEADPKAVVATMPARVLAGLMRRRDAGGGPITMLPCDNLPGNGAAARAALTGIAEVVDPSMASWMEENVDFATCMVDRITPATTDEDRETVATECGWQDAWPVPTEPYHEWIIEGRFPAGRPDWESAGARIVDDVEPFEQRKLWLLNGSHSLMAYAGSVRGLETIAEAIADPAIRGWVRDFWDEAARHLSLPPEEIEAYRADLLVRFANPRIRHNLAQIAADGSTKLPVRTLPTARAERAAGLQPHGCAIAIAAWVRHLRGEGAPVKDAQAGPAQEAAAAADVREAIRGVLATMDATLAEDVDFVRLVVACYDEIGGAGADQLG